MKFFDMPLSFFLSSLISPSNINSLFFFTLLLFIKTFPTSRLSQKSIPYQFFNSFQSFRLNRISLSVNLSHPDYISFSNILFQTLTLPFCLSPYIYIYKYIWLNAINYSMLISNSLIGSLDKGESIALLKFHSI